MTVPAPSRTIEVQARKAQGRAFLSEDRIEDALRIYANILRENPQDVESYLFLGDCYLADGDGETAQLLYSQALTLCPESPEIRRRLQLAQIQHYHTATVPRKPIPTDLEAIASLLQKLTGQCSPVSEEEVIQAGQLLEAIVNSPRPARMVADRLEEINALIPALLELNIRQARADGRPDLAQALQNLADNIQLQMDSRPSAPASELPADSMSHGQTMMRVLFLIPDGDQPAMQTSLPAEALAELGCKTTITSKISPGSAGDFDIVVACHPQGDTGVMESLAVCAAASRPIILLLESNFEQMPVDHPDYERLGLGTPARARSYTSALLLANVVFVSNEAFAASLRDAGRQVRVIPEGWYRRNILWGKHAASRHTINLGWVGSPGQVEDVAQVRRIVIRVLREFPQTRLIIGDDLQVYKLFNSLPESRRLFLPSMSREDYPYVLSQVDILIEPVRNIPFTQSQSDRKLMEAGIRGIPWVASPIPAYQEWQSGGLIASTLDEWHTYLRQLVLDAGLRASLGQAGRQQAETREMSILGLRWYKLLSEVMHSQP